MGKIKCSDCDSLLLAKELKFCTETEADESGVYIVFVYRCPNCFCEIRDRRLKHIEGYKAPSNDEPLRWET